MKPTITTTVANRSSREGGRPKLLVLHTTEGGTIQSVIAEFNDNASQASSHVVNNAQGESARLVPDSEKSWSVCSYNPFTLNIEQCGFAAMSKEEWFKNANKQLSNTAAWLAEWSVAHDVPLRKGIASGSTLRIFRTGIVQHKDLGTLGCGHSDCGSGYPQGYVTKLARLIVEEHHLGRPHGKTASRLRRSLNRQRRHYGLPEFTEPRIS